MSDAHLGTRPTYIPSVKGSGRGGRHQQQQPALGRKGILPYTLACTVKSRPGPRSTTNDQERKKEEKRCLFFARAGLASYLCRACPMCVNLSRLGGGIHPTTLDATYTPRCYTHI